MRIQSIEFLVGHRLPVRWTQVVANLGLLVGLAVGGYLVGLPAWAYVSVAAWELGAILDAFFRVFGGYLAGGDWGPGKEFLTRYFLEAGLVGVALGVRWLPGKSFGEAVLVLLALVPIVALGCLFWMATVIGLGVSEPPALTLTERATDADESSGVALEDYLAYAAAAALFGVLGRERAARMLRLLGTPWFWRAHLGAWHDKIWRRNTLRRFLVAAQSAGLEDAADRLFRFLTAAAERTGACEGQAIRRLGKIGKALGLDEEMVRRGLRALEAARRMSRREAAAILGVSPEAGGSEVEAAYQRRVAEVQPGSEALVRLVAARARLLSSEDRSGRG